VNEERLGFLEKRRIGEGEEDGAVMMTSNGSAVDGQQHVVGGAGQQRRAEAGTGSVVLSPSMASGADDVYPDESPKTASSQQQNATLSDNLKQKQKITLWDNLFSLHGSIQKPLNFQKYRKRLKSLIRYHGVPSIYRPKVWLESSGAHLKIEQNRGYYQKMIQIHSTHQNVAERQIELDLARTFPMHPYFNTDESEGRARLRRILTAFSWRNPLVAYCQSLNFLVGILLLHFDEDEAFWMLVVILEEILPADFYNPQLKGVRTDGKVLDSLIQFYLPKIHKKFQDLQMDTSPFVTRWFMTLYVDVLPIETAMRVWDVMFHEGSKVMFRVALSLLKLNENAILKCAHMGEVLHLFNGVTENMYDADKLMKTCFSFYTLRNKSIDRKRATCATLVEQETQEMEARRQDAQKRIAAHKERVARERAAQEETEKEDNGDMSPQHSNTRLIVEPATPNPDDDRAMTHGDGTTTTDTLSHPTTSEHLSSSDKLLSAHPSDTLNSSSEDHSADEDDDDDMDAQIETVRMSTTLQEGELNSLIKSIRDENQRKRSASVGTHAAAGTTSRGSPQKIASTSTSNTKHSDAAGNTPAVKLYHRMLQSREGDMADLKELDILMQQHELFAAAYE